MKIIHKIFKSKFRDYIIGASVLVICICTLITVKIIENRNLEIYVDSQLEDLDQEESLEVFSPNGNTYDEFIGTSASNFIEELESNFWEIVEDKQSYSTFQNAYGNIITIHYTEEDIIETIEVFELE